MRNNKKGFTLIELLAVIVILAVVMLIAVSAVGPLMAKSRKGALENEGIALSNAAKTAFQAEQLNANSAIKATSTVCFDLEYLYNQKYYEKGDAQGYTGSVLVTYANGDYTYKIWISNKTYAISEKAPNAINLDTDVTDATSASNNCNNATSVIKCAKQDYTAADGTTKNGFICK